MKKILLTGLIALSCFALDSDLDGVPDNIDICPNTPFLETVNKNGCSTSQLKKIKKHKKTHIKYTFSVGYEYDGVKNDKNTKTAFTSLSAKKENYKLSLYYSFYNDGYTNKYKSSDLILSFYYYNYSIKNTSLKFGIKSYLPTYYNDKTDYAFLIEGTYFFNTFDIGASEKHKIYGESGTNDKDTITLFADFPYKKLLISPYAYTENSSYNASKWYKYTGITLFYPISKQIGVSLDYSIDIETNQNYTLNGSVFYSF